MKTVLALIVGLSAIAIIVWIQIHAKTWWDEITERSVNEITEGH